MLTFHLCLVHVLVPSGLYAFLMSPCYVPLTVSPVALIVFVKNANYEAPHFEVFLQLLIFSVSEISLNSQTIRISVTGV
jgi:hypothetical protein